MDSRDAENILLPKEEVLWCGQPNTKKLFNKQDLYFVPFSIFWCGFAIFWTVTAAMDGGLFAVFGIPFVLVGLYITVGRFFVKNRQKRNTIYLLTDKRVITIVKGANGKENIKVADILSVANVSKSSNSKGIGTIIFGQKLMAAYSNSGIEMMSSINDGSVAFYDIDDCDTVYKLFNEAKAKNEK